MMIAEAVIAMRQRRAAINISGCKSLRQRVPSNVKCMSFEEQDMVLKIIQQRISDLKGLEQ